MTLPATYKKLVRVHDADTFDEAVQIVEEPLSAPNAKEILVKTTYTGVNAADYLMAIGRYLSPTPPPYDLGAESCGIVAAIGDEVQGITIGDAVFVPYGGGYREYFTVPAQHAVPIPQASAAVVSLGISGLTAIMALEQVGEMGQGETVMVTAAAGGTGHFVVQLAKLAGNHVIGTCGSNAKVDFLRALECDRPINYKQEDVQNVLKQEYPNGVDLVFESVGGKMFDTCVNALGTHGRLVIIGAISEYESGPQPVTDVRVLYKLLPKSASLRAFWLVHYFSQVPQYLAQLLQLVQEGKLQAHHDPTPFIGVEAAQAAIEHMYGGHNIGKVIVSFPF